MSWTEEDIEFVWGKGAPSTEPNTWRKDKCTAWIKRDKYGDRNSTYGWEIDHIDGNPDNNVRSNLQPLQWENNVAKSDSTLKCVVVSDGTRNVRAS